jgi:hypothetical protein
MKIGKPRRKVTVEPIRNPVPKEKTAPARTPAKRVLTG